VVLVGVSVICASFLPGAASASLLNPSFEIGAPSSVSNTGATYNTTGIPDWTLSEFTLTAGEYPATGGFSALSPVPNGTYFAYTSGGSIFQTVGTVVAGTTYTLTAWIAYYNQFVQTAYLYDNGTPVLAASATGTTNGVWTLVSGSYTPTSGTGDPLTILLFANGEGGAFDEIGLTGLPTPLPASWTMMLAGLAGFGFFAVYRRKKNDSTALAAA
jgi:hypothetical protein